MSINYWATQNFPGGNEHTNHKHPKMTPPKDKCTKGPAVMPFIQKQTSRHS
jgi:hypothetical protein